MKFKQVSEQHIELQLKFFRSGHNLLMFNET